MLPYQLSVAVVIILYFFLTIMGLLALSLLPVVATLRVGLALVPNDMELTMVKPTPDSSNLAPLPSPFAVPGTEITLDFLPQPAFFPQPLETDVAQDFRHGQI